MEWLKENRNIVIIIAIIVIGYLLLKTHFFGNLYEQSMMQWTMMGNFGKLLIVLIIVGIAYYYYTKEQ